MRNLLPLLIPALVLVGYLASLGMLLFMSIVSGIQTLILVGILHVLYALWSDAS